MKQHIKLGSREIKSTSSPFLVWLWNPLVSHKTSSHHGFHREGGEMTPLCSKVCHFWLYSIKLPLGFHCCNFNHLLFQKKNCFQHLWFFYKLFGCIYSGLKTQWCTFVLFLNYCNFVDGTYGKLMLYKKYIIVIIPLLGISGQWQWDLQPHPNN